jgi:hypothetical protein
MTTNRAAADFGQTNNPPRVSTELSPAARSTTLPNPSQRQDAGPAARAIPSDAGSLCPCMRLQWLQGL